MNSFELTGKQQRILLLLIAVGLLITASIYLSVDLNSDKARQLEFTAEAKEIGHAIEKEMTFDLETMFAINALYSVSDSVNREKFRDFTQHILDNHLAIQALEWIPKVDHIDRDRYESAAVEWMEGFQFTERADGRMMTALRRDQYFPVYYVEPLQGNEKAVGFDLASNPVRKAALDKADSLNTMVATARITLVQETGSQKGFLGLSPVKKDGVLTGFIAGVFRIDNMVRTATDNILKPKFSVELYDLSADPGEQLLSFVGFRELRSLPDDYSYTPAKGLNHIHEFAVADRQWMVVINEHRPFLQPLAEPAILILLICVFLFALIFFYVFRNFTALNIQRRNELQMLKKNEELKQFTYVASHDLQEPLGQIRNFTGLMKTEYQGQFDGHFETYLKYIDDAAEYMSSLVKGLLDYSLLEENTALSKVNFNHIVKLVINALVSEHGLDLSDFRVGRLPVVRSCEPHIRILFQNLLHNAVKYRKNEEDLRVTINAHYENGFWEFRIRDNGIGIDEKHTEKIFTIFRRLHRRESYAGTGIGLSLCKKIVEAHGGEIWVESRLGVGSTFIFKLPD